MQPENQPLGWYHRIDGAVYSVGGALAEFLWTR
jgi:hypothetical protein